jgi:hypothetical protein
MQPIEWVSGEEATKALAILEEWVMGITTTTVEDLRALERLVNQAHKRINDLNIFLANFATIKFAETKDIQDADIPFPSDEDWQQFQRIDLWADDRREKYRKQKELDNKIYDLEKQGFIVKKKEPPDPPTLAQAVLDVHLGVKNEHV